MKKLKELYDKWCLIPDKIRFLIIGCYNSAFSYIIYALAIIILGAEHYQICVALQWIISSVFSYVHQKLFVFCTKGHWIEEYFKCCTTWVISYICNAVILEIIIRNFTKNVYLGQFISLGLAAIVTYVLFKHFAFKNTDKE